MIEPSKYIQRVFPYIHDLQMANGAIILKKTIDINDNLVLDFGFNHIDQLHFRDSFLIESILFKFPTVRNFPDKNQLNKGFFILTQSSIDYLRFPIFAISKKRMPYRFTVPIMLFGSKNIKTKILLPEALKLPKKEVVLIVVLYGVLISNSTDVR